MATQPEVRQRSTRRTPFRLIGVIMLVAGIAGLGYWQMQAFETSLHSIVADDSLAAEIVDEDWVPMPGIENPEDEVILVVGKDQSGNVIWQGTEEDWGALWDEGVAAHEADLRRTWLYPSTAVALAGLLLTVFGRRLSAANSNHV